MSTPLIEKEFISVIAFLFPDNAPPLTAHEYRFMKGESIIKTGTIQANDYEDLLEEISEYLEENEEILLALKIEKLETGQTLTHLILKDINTFIETPVAVTTPLLHEYYFHQGKATIKNGTIPFDYEDLLEGISEYVEKNKAILLSIYLERFPNGHTLSHLRLKDINTFIEPPYLTEIALSEREKELVSVIKKIYDYKASLVYYEEDDICAYEIIKGDKVIARHTIGIEYAEDMVFDTNKLLEIFSDLIQSHTYSEDNNICKFIITLKD